MTNDGRQVKILLPVLIMNKLINILDSQFQNLHVRSKKIAASIPNDKLFWQPTDENPLFPSNSCGEHILRSAGKVEQTFGGITAQLWDDPFEWTLPEMLSTNKKILKYLEEVEETRLRGFGFFKSDEDLLKEIPAPEKLTVIFQLLIETIAKAENFQGRAISLRTMFSE